MKYAVNECVVYGADGICQIEEISKRKFGREIVEYYKLKPMFDDKSAIYIPVDNKALVAKMRNVITKDELFAMLEGLDKRENVWVNDDRERQEAFKAIIGNGNREDLFVLIRTIYERRKELTDKGKKLHAADERMLRDAQKLLHEELAYILGIERSEVGDFIAEKIEQFA